MGVVINHVISAMIEPMTVFLFALLAGLVLLARGRRMGWGFVIGSLCWLWFFASPLMIWFVGAPLERAYPPTAVEKLPQADAIVLLSGGMGGKTNIWEYGEMWESADRVWHAGRVWKARKAPILIATGYEEDRSSQNLLTDIGVPAECIVTENESLNTEENIKFTLRILKERFPEKKTHRVLLVTSAWHMRRSLLMFKKYAPEVEAIPAAADYTYTLYALDKGGLSFLRPTVGNLLSSGIVLKEVVGYWGYRLRGW